MRSYCDDDAQFVKEKDWFAKRLDLELIIEGWVERSDTHRLLAVRNLMGIAALNPSYKI
jgi:hypothetical protein